MEVDKPSQAWLISELLESTQDSKSYLAHVVGFSSIQAAHFCMQTFVLGYPDEALRHKFAEIVADDLWLPPSDLPSDAPLHQVKDHQLNVQLFQAARAAFVDVAVSPVCG
jgi:hypothetical protein